MGYVWQGNDYFAVFFKVIIHKEFQNLISMEHVFQDIYGVQVLFSQLLHAYYQYYSKLDFLGEIGG